MINACIKKKQKTKKNKNEESPGANIQTAGQLLKTKQNKTKQNPNKHISTSGHIYCYIEKNNLWIFTE